MERERKREKKVEKLSVKVLCGREVWWLWWWEKEELYRGIKTKCVDGEGRKEGM